MTQAGPEDVSHGLVRLTVPGEIRAGDSDRLTFEEWTRTVACPQCGTTSGLTLQADYDEAVVICPQEQRAFRDPAISALSVRLLAAQPVDQDNLDLPRGGYPWFDMTPLLEESRTSPDFRYRDELEEEDPRDVWERHFNVTAEEKWPRFVVAMSWARSLMSWALPHHGRLFHQVFGADTLRPDREAHMILVALGLAIYESAFQAGTGKRMAVLLLTAPMQWLRPGLDAADRRRQLLAVRPLGDPDFGGRLRLTDLARLEDCTEEEWDRWCEAAFAVLTVHLTAARIQAVQEHGGRVDPPERARLTDRRPALCIGEDAYHWYSEPALVP